MWSWRPPQHQPHHTAKERSKGSQTTAPREACRKYRAFQRSHGASSPPAATTVWVAPAHPLPHEFPGISTGSHTAASPQRPCLTHTDPTPALWDLSQVFWRKSKLSECDGLLCSGFAHLQKLFCWGFFLAFAASIPSSALSSASCTQSNNPPNFTRSRAAPLPHHQLQREAGSTPNQASGITLPPRGIWKKKDKGAA